MIHDIKLVNPENDKYSTINLILLIKLALLIRKRNPKLFDILWEKIEELTGENMDPDNIEVY